MLQVDGRLAAIIDLDYATTGDAAFDLTFLAVSSLEYECYEYDDKTKHMLMEIGLEGLDQARRLAYVANIILRFLDWAIRKNRPSEIDFWLDHADWLFEAREAAGVSQRDLAVRMSTSQAAVARLEAGGTSATLTTLRKAAAALGLELTIDLAPAH